MSLTIKYIFYINVKLLFLFFMCLIILFIKLYSIIYLFCFIFLLLKTIYKSVSFSFIVSLTKTKFLRYIFFCIFITIHSAVLLIIHINLFHFRHRHLIREPSFFFCFLTLITQYLFKFLQKIVFRSFKSTPVWLGFFFILPYKWIK